MINWDADSGASLSSERDLKLSPDSKSSENDIKPNSQSEEVRNGLTIELVLIWQDPRAELSESRSHERLKRDNVPKELPTPKIPGKSSFNELNRGLHIVLNWM